MKKILVILFLGLVAFTVFEHQKPTLYIIGDSTVRNGDGSGKNQQWGWGSFIGTYFDSNKISVQNLAIGGRSSRTFITEGRWEKIVANLKKGDYVLMQFGHNDGGPLDDTARARGTIRGIGNELKEIYNPITKKQETVYTYGYYMRKYIREAKEKGAIAIVCSPIPRNDWKDGKVIRSNDSYALWAEQVAKEESAYFIPLNDLVSLKFEELGAAEVAHYFPIDHTHTNLDGAKINAAIVMDELKKMNPSKIKKYLN